MKLSTLISFAVALGALWGGPARAQPASEARETLRVCLNDVPHLPWRLADAQGKVRDQGLDFVFLNLLAQRAKVQVEISLVPWKRCLAEVKAGQQDAVLGISYLPEREELGHYPQLAGQPDESLAVRHDQYAWYAPVASPIAWNGRQLHGLMPDALVGVQTGYSVATVVKGLGFKVDEAARTAEANLEKLVRGRVSAVALQAKEADRVLALKPALGQAVRKLEPVLQNRAYYMLFSRPFAANSARPLSQWWRDVVWVRDSEAYRRAEAEGLKAMEEAMASP